MIHVLDKQTVDQIAAGEVIERPCAVVKELVENAIDANATMITVEIKEGGKSLIRVTDNGCGIAHDEVHLAFKRHATSKINSFEDLLKVSSLGFRGEALSSIASVSKLEVVTKKKDSVCGFRFCMEGGEETADEEVGCPDGTTFLIRQLFYNTPARLKFLKSDQTETSYISELMEQFSLSHPEVAFRFIYNGKNALATAGRNQIKDVIHEIYGREITKCLLETNRKTDHVSLTGFIGKPEISRGNRLYMNYFINGRYIKSKIIHKAIEDAYKDFTMVHKYPFTALYYEMDSQFVDVNVHPTKMEVRFNNEQEIYDITYQTVHQALTQSTLIPEAEFSSITKKEEPKPVPKQHFPEPFELKRNEQLFKHMREPKITHYEQKSMLKENDLPETVSLIKENPEPDIRIIGQVFDTYWLFEREGQLLVLDQHAAHEKIMYEKIRDQIDKGGVTTQNVSPPIIVTLGLREIEVLKKYQTILSDIGFEVECFGGNEYSISQVPAEFVPMASKDYFMELIDMLSVQNERVGDTLKDKCASMACKAAVKGNHAMSKWEADGLIRKLFTLKEPYHCPHGRPTMVSMEKKDFEKMFKRIGG